MNNQIPPHNDLLPALDAAGLDHDWAGGWLDGRGHQNAGGLLRHRWMISNGGGFWVGFVNREEVCRESDVREAARLTKEALDA